MFKLKRSNDFYENGYSEYFIEKYPFNFLKFGIDIGACGICHKWHINHMGKNNPNSTFIGFEPETNGFKLIKKECKSLENVKLYQEFFGRNISLKDVLENHNLNPEDRWFVSCDCEGDEKYLFNNKEDLEILKKATHIAFEIHPKMANMKYNDFVEIFKNEFGETHKIIRTFHGEGGEGVYDNSCFILTKKDVYLDELENIISKLKKINIKEKYPWFSKYHRIEEFN